MTSTQTMFDIIDVINKADHCLYSSKFEMECAKRNFTANMTRCNMTESLGIDFDVAITAVQDAISKYLSIKLAFDTANRTVPANVTILKSNFYDEFIVHLNEVKTKARLDDNTSRHRNVEDDDYLCDLYKIMDLLK